MTSFYSDIELKALGLKSFGTHVLISKKASIYSPSSISVGDYVRIDDFSILSGRIEIGSHVHISAYVALYGSMGICIGDYAGLSARSTVYSAVDDFGGDYLIGPMCPEEMTNVTGGTVYLKNYTQVGASSVIMPHLTLEEGAVAGAMSFVNKSLSAWSINAGIPCRFLRPRSKNLLNKL